MKLIILNIALFSSLLFSTLSLGQTDCNVSADSILKEAFRYYKDSIEIDDHLYEENHFSIKHRLYVIKFYNLIADKKDLSYTIDVIYNNSSLGNVNPKYYCEIEDRLILVKTTNNELLNHFKELNISQLNPNILKTVNDKLLDSKDGYIMSHANILIGSINNCSSKYEYIYPAIDSPTIYFIYDYSIDYLPQPELIGFKKDSLENSFVFLEDFKAFRQKEKFILDNKITYPGISNTNLKTELTHYINLAANDFEILTRTRKATEKEYQLIIKKGLARFKGIYSELDTEDRERICLYFQELMDIALVKSSDGELNKFMYNSNYFN